MKPRKPNPDLIRLGEAVKAARLRIDVDIAGMATAVGMSIGRIVEAESGHGGIPPIETISAIDLITDSEGYLLRLHRIASREPGCPSAPHSPDDTEDDPVNRRALGKGTIVAFASFTIPLPWSDNRISPDLVNLSAYLDTLCSVQDSQAVRTTVAQSSALMAACKRALRDGVKPDADLLLILGRASLVRADASREMGDHNGAAWLSRSAFSYGVAIDDLGLCAIAQSELAAIALDAGNTAKALGHLDAGLACTPTGQSGVRLLLQKATALATVDDRSGSVRATGKAFGLADHLPSSSLSSRVGNWFDSIALGEVWHHGTAAMCRAGCIPEAESYSRACGKLWPDDETKFAGMRHANLALMYANAGQLDAATHNANTALETWKDYRANSGVIRLAEVAEAIPNDDLRERVHTWMT